MIKRVLRRLQRKAADRTAAAKAPEPMTPEAVQELLVRFERKVVAHKNRGCILNCLCVILLVPVLLGVLVALVDGELPAYYWGLLFVACVGFFLRRATTVRHFRELTGVLARLEDVRAVGPLVEALELSDRRTRALAEQALARLLPRLQASDAGLLNEIQRDDLHLALRGSNRPLILAILKALEQVGDSRSLWYVEGLAAEDYWTAFPMVKDKQVQEAARECLVYLQERIEAERVRQTLLRPASAPDAPADMLLRPAQGVSEADPQTLLRPSAPEDG